MCLFIFVFSLCTYQCGGKGNCTYSYTQGYYSSYYQGYYAIDTCACNTGYYGMGCTLFTCSNECNYNGLCVDYNVCSCYRGYKGQFCNIDCGCDSHGTCSNSTNSCICTKIGSPLSLHCGITQTTFCPFGGSVT